MIEVKAIEHDLPRKIDWIDKIETLVIDDGSQDETAATARRIGVDHVLSLKSHKSLASAFSEGIDRSLELAADIIVNTDADNQYAGDDIPQLVRPILDGEARSSESCQGQRSKMR